MAVEDIEDNSRKISHDNQGHDVRFGVFETLLMAGTVVLLVITFPLMVWACIRIVPQYERGVLFRLGKLKKGAKGPGVCMINPFIDEMLQIDMRTQSFDIPPQEVLTKDCVTIRVDAVVFYHVHDVVMSVVNVDDVEQASHLLAQSTFTATLGIKTLAEILNQRQILAEVMSDAMDRATDAWGITIERIELKDVRLPLQLQRAMASEAEATREAKAKVISADGELSASRKLKEAADVVGDAANAMQLRFLQTLAQVSGNKNETVIVPIPAELIKKLAKTNFFKNLDDPNYEHRARKAPSPVQEPSYAPAPVQEPSFTRGFSVTAGFDGIPAAEALSRKSAPSLSSSTGQVPLSMNRSAPHQVPEPISLVKRMKSTHVIDDDESLRNATASLMEIMP